MALEASETEGIVVVTLGKRLDTDTTPATEKALKPILDRHPARVLFDFSGTEYIASAGLRMLLSSARSIMKGGGTIALCSLSPTVRQVFEIAGFTKIFTIYPDREDALRGLKG